MPRTSSPRSRGGRPPSWVDVDLGAIAANARFARRLAGGAALLAVVKEDAYGHGAVAVARTLAPQARAFAVATLAEGLALRRAGIRAPVLLLVPLAEPEIRPALRGGLLPTLASFADLRALPGRPGEAPAAHAKFDTGISRFGFLPSQAAALGAALRRRGVRRLAGTYTHLASGADPGRTLVQLARFDAALRALRGCGVEPGLTHAANSDALVAVPRARRYGAVRPGLLLYGVPPAGRTPAGVRPAMAFRARVAAVRDLPAGTRVGYDGTWRAPGPCRLAVLPVGYAAGFDRRWSNRGVGLWHGRPLPVRGRVSMNVTLLDATRARGIRPGDAVTLFGRDGRAGRPVRAYAAALGTIPYEPLCVAGSLNPRVYHGSRA